MFYELQGGNLKYYVKQAKSIIESFTGEDEYSRESYQQNKDIEKQLT